jgi:hypothetical protein
MIFPTAGAPRVNPSPRNIVRALASFDFLVTALLAFPVSARGFLDVLFHLNGYFGGASTPPAFDGIHWLFVNLAGVLGVLWAAVRIATPSRLLAGLDAGGRVWVSLLILWYVLVGGAPGLLLLFAGTELGGAFAEGRLVRAAADWGA